MLCFFGTELLVSVVSQSRENVLLKKILKVALTSLEDAVCKYFYNALYLVIESCSYVGSCSYFLAVEILRVFAFRSF